MRLPVLSKNGDAAARFVCFSYMNDCCHDSLCVSPILRTRQQSDEQCRWCEKEKLFKITLRKDLVRDIKRGHMWVYSDAIDRVKAAPGTVAILVDIASATPR